MGPAFAVSMVGTSHALVGAMGSIFSGMESWLASAWIPGRAVRGEGGGPTLDSVCDDGGWTWAVDVRVVEEKAVVAGDVPELRL